MYVKILAQLQYLLPHHLLARLVGLLTNSRNKALKDFLIKRFIATYHVDMQEALYPHVHDYASFNAFFTRRLRPETRPIAQEENSIVSPIDGQVYAVGKIQHDTLIQAKQKTFSLTTLLGGNKELAHNFNGGYYLCTYLAPHNYHRVHMPYTGTLQHMCYVPGHLFAVAPFSAANIQNIFARNERVICIFNTDIGKLALILVGAMNVGSIHTTWVGQVTPQHPRRMQSWDYPQGATLARGTEMGLFQMGSTVIVLCANSSIQWQPSLTQCLLKECSLKMGQMIGVVKHE